MEVAEAPSDIPQLMGYEHPTQWGGEGPTSLIRFVSRFFFDVPCQVSSRHPIRNKLQGSDSDTPEGKKLPLGRRAV